jgi:hypothetical protein
MAGCSAVGTCRVYPAVCDQQPRHWQPQKSGATARFHLRRWRQNAASWSSKPSISRSQAGCVSRTLNAATPLPNLLARDGQNRAHPRPRQWLWLAGGGCASCPLLQRCSPKFLPLGFAHSSRNQETPVCPVLHCVAALRVQRCKPLPVTSHRGRE